MSEEAILIRGLRVSTRIGVPEAERSQPQEIALDLVIVPKNGMADLNDDVARTIDYDLVAREVRSLCGSGERKLIETLAEDIASLVLDRYPASAVEVTLRKFILPDCDHVAVRLRREVHPE